MRIKTFDGARAFAIFLVLLAHWLAANPELKDSIGSPFSMILGNGSFGVRLFFVLSGYLITSLLLKEHAQF